MKKFIIEDYQPNSVIIEDDILLNLMRNILKTKKHIDNAHDHLKDMQKILNQEIPASPPEKYDPIYVKLQDAIKERENQIINNKTNKIISSKKYYK